MPNALNGTTSPRAPLPEAEVKDHPASSLFHAVSAELLGAFLLTFAMIASFASPAFLGEGGLITVALGLGCATAVTMGAMAPISGGHLNPVLTFSAWLSGEMGRLRGGLFLLAQVAGALIAARFATSLLPQDALIGGQMGAPLIQAPVTLAAAVVLEAFATLLLVLSWLRQPRARRPLYAGMAVFLAMLMVGPFSGAAVNPLRVLAPWSVLELQAMPWPSLAGAALGALIGGLLERGRREKKGDALARSLAEGEQR